MDNIVGQTLLCNGCFQQPRLSCSPKFHRKTSLLWQLTEADGCIAFHSICTYSYKLEKPCNMNDDCTWRPNHWECRWDPTSRILPKE